MVLASIAKTYLSLSLSLSAKCAYLNRQEYVQVSRRRMSTPAPATSLKAPLVSSRSGLGKMQNEKMQNAKCKNAKCKIQYAIRTWQNATNMTDIYSVWWVLSCQTQRCLLFLGLLWVYEISNRCFRTVWAPRSLEISLHCPCTEVAISGPYN